MPKIISSDIVVAYSQCLRKAFLLLIGEQGVTVEYVDILNQQKSLPQNKHIESANLSGSAIQIDEASDLKWHGNTLLNANLKSGYFEAGCDILTQVDKASSSQKAGYEPTIFIGTHGVNKEHRLELAFVGYILGKIDGHFPEQGTIVNAGGESHRVNLKSLSRSLRKIISPLQDWLTFSPSQPPPIILNKHCLYCQFQKSCKLQAEQADNLSLLSGMTAKAIQRYEKKGIFTIKQLSYLFKPRRLKKQFRFNSQARITGVGNSHRENIHSGYAEPFSAEN
jgi:predicted RecB family nuclease